MPGENQSDSQQESHIQQQQQQPSQRQSLLEKRKTMIQLPGNMKQ